MTPHDDGGGGGRNICIIHYVERPGEEKKKYREILLAFVHDL
jgi:hypothetical protein